MEKLYINAGTVIVNLIKEEKKSSLSLSHLDNLIDYIYDQLIDMDIIKNYQNVIFNVSFDAIERTVIYNNKLFELIGDTIFLKCDEIPDRIITQYTANRDIVKIIKNFVNNHSIA